MTDIITITVKSILNGYIVIGFLGEHYCKTWEELMKYVEQELEVSLK